MIRKIQKWVNYQGRNKYQGANMSLASDSTVAVNGGNNNSYNGNNGQGNDYTSDVVKPWQLYLTKTSNTFDKADMKAGPVTDTSYITGYVDTDRMPVYIGNLELDEEKTDYAISGLSSGITVVVDKNGTTGASIDIEMTIDAPKEGTLVIPANMLRSNSTIFDTGKFIDWRANRNSCITINLEYHWRIDENIALDESYVLDLSNQTAQINADANYNILPGAVRPECVAKLMHGSDDVPTAVYSMYIDPIYNAKGVAINSSTGVLTFDLPNEKFNFDGTALPIHIFASVDGSSKSIEKQMTVTKVAAGADGSSPVSRWIVTSPNEITVNRNTVPATLSSNKVIATIWKQEGENTPETDASTTGYWWYKGDAVGSNNFNSTVEVPLNVTTSGVTFGLLKAGGNRADIKHYYELEDVPFVYGGKDGNEGSQGPQGPSGETGQSVYTLVLSNQNSGVNCDLSGNPYPASIATLQCKATLYYGKTPVVMRGEGENEYYDLVEDNNSTVHGVGIDNEYGNLSFTNIYFDEGARNGSIRVIAHYDGQVFEALMGIYKIFPGADGTSPTNRWLNLSSTEILHEKDKSPTPDTIEAKALKQVGDGIIDYDDDAVIEYYKWFRNSGRPEDHGTTYNNTITITSADCETYFKYEFVLKYGGKVIDRQDCMFLVNGSDGIGTRGLRGATVRGPVEWIDDGMEERRFYAGIEDKEHPEQSEPYIDIVYYDGHYYRCIESFSSYPTDVWADVSQYFEQADAEYKFIATDLLLSREAKIKFLTNSEIYMVDDDDIIYGGMKAVNDDNDIIMWAGNQDPKNGRLRIHNDGSLEIGGTLDNSTPPKTINPTFSISPDGVMIANKGTFAGNIRVPYTFINELDINYQMYCYYTNPKYFYIADTIDLGYLDNAPTEDLENWMHYIKNSNKQHYVYYNGSWRTATVQSTAYGVVGNGYLADDRSNIISDGWAGDYGMGNGPELILPNPSAELNGFTYHIVTTPNIATKAAGQNPSINIRCVTIADVFKIYIYSKYVEDSARVSSYGGKIEITCGPMHTGNGEIEYKWIVTQCTGSIDCWRWDVSKNDFELNGSYSIMFGYSNDPYYTPAQICVTETVPDANHREVDTIYMKRG